MIPQSAAFVKSSMSLKLPGLSEYIQTKMMTLTTGIVAMRPLSDGNLRPICVQRMITATLTISFVKNSIKSPFASYLRIFEDCIRVDCGVSRTCDAVVHRPDTAASRAYQLKRRTVLTEKNSASRTLCENVRILTYSAHCDRLRLSVYWRISFHERRLFFCVLSRRRRRCCARLTKTDKGNGVFRRIEIKGFPYGIFFEKGEPETP